MSTSMMPAYPRASWCTILSCLFLSFRLAMPVALSDEPAANATQRAITIVTLGDSITKGIRRGVTAEQTFASLLESQLKEQGAVRVVNVGIGGERTDQAWQRISQVTQLQPDIVTVMYGTNDSYVDKGKTTSRITVDEYRENLNRIVSELLRLGIVPVLMTEPRWSDNAGANGVGENPNVRLEPYVVACREIAKTWRLPLVDHFAKWTEAREKGVNLHEWTTDGCHPNPAGHHEMTTVMLPTIRQTIGAELAIRKKLEQAAPVRVVCFGDSVTGVYYHTGSRRAYADMLGIALRRAYPNEKVEVINAGISGNTTVNALARIDRDVLDHKPDLVTVMFGLNDMTRVPIEEYRSNLKQIVTRCRSTGSDVMLATPNNVIDTGSRPSNKLIQYCDVVREVGSEMNVAVCDIYRELDAERARDPFGWRLLMSDAIHPNMDGHKRVATSLAQTICRQRILLNDVPPPAPAISHTLDLIKSKKPIRVLAMPPCDELIRKAILAGFPDAELTIEPWNVSGLSVKEIERDANSRVRNMKPDLVVIGVPRSAQEGNDEEFASAYAWIMNWSLNFGAPTWDCVVVHPSLVDPQGNDTQRDDLVRRLVRAQDLTLIDRPAGNESDAAKLVHDWVKSMLMRK